MVETNVLSINQTFEWRDIIVPLENIMKFLHSVLIHHDKNDSNGPNCDPTEYLTKKSIRKSITKLARNDTSALKQLLFAWFYGESWHEATGMMEKEVRLMGSKRNKCNDNDNDNNENNFSIDSYYNNIIYYHDVPIYY